MTFDLLQINPPTAPDKFRVKLANKHTEVEHTARKDVGATGCGAKLEIQA